MKLCTNKRGEEIAHYVNFNMNAVGEQIQMKTELHANGGFTVISNEVVF